MTASPVADPSGVDALQHLTDTEQAVDALYRFAAGQDEKDRALFESAFAADARLDFTQPARRLGASLPVFEGRTAIANTIFATLAPLRTTHTVTNPRVELARDEATLRALVEAQHVRGDDERDRLLLKNRYVVGLRRDRGRWVIVDLVIENVWWSGEAAVLFPPPER
jgi:hypothetical protein